VSDIYLGKIASAGAVPSRLAQTMDPAENQIVGLILAGLMPLAMVLGTMEEYFPVSPVIAIVEYSGSSSGFRSFNAFVLH
jgi:hypothetical protein